MSLTLTHEELCSIKCTVEDIFVKYEMRHTELNKFGSKNNMNEGNELFVYTWLLNDICFPSDFQSDNTYESILSNRDIFKIYNRALTIASSNNF